MNENAEVREEVFYEKKKGRKNTGLMIFLIVLAVFSDLFLLWQLLVRTAQIPQILLILQ